MLAGLGLKGLAGLGGPFRGGFGEPRASEI